MRTSFSATPHPLITAGLLALSVLSGAARADDVVIAEPRWPALPIWGAEAEAKGYQVPRPFGIGLTAFSARQPVNIHDLQLGRNGNEPVSVKNVLQIDRVDTSQQNVSAKFDVLVFPFLESVLGICVGCIVFRGLMRLGVIPEEVCLECADISLRRTAQAAGPTTRSR